MLDGNIFLIMTVDDDYFGKIAIAEKVPRNSNLLSVIQRYNAKTVNVCKTWSHAKDLEDYWNRAYRENGSQKCKFK